MIEAILCYIFKGGKVLLQKKSKGFGKGKWNGPGGKVNQGEAPAIAAKREVMEETGLVVNAMENRGRILFHLNDKEWIVHIFRTEDFDGDPIDGGEGELRWFDPAKLPYDTMWPDDRHWMPLFLEGRAIDAEFWITEDAVLDHRIKVIGMKTEEF
jgi:8-oxo-dGTP pyrophosphatase MutT (NUDIX family)